MGKQDNDYEELLHKMESKINRQSRKSRRFKEDKEFEDVEEVKSVDDYVSDDISAEEDDKAYRKATKKELKRQRKEEKKAEKRRKKKRHIIRKIFLTIFTLLLIAIIVFAIFIIKNGGGLKGILTTIVGSDAEQVKNLEDLTFLAVGKSQGMTDTIMIMKYSPKNQTLSMVSVQRDTYTGSNDATATASDKINAKYPMGGIQSLLRAVNSLTGLNLKKYVVVDTKALRDLVDVIGGVDFDVPIDMDYDDCTQDLAIHLKAGMQHLNGEQAEGVVRFRHNNNGTSYPVSYGDNDLGRMRTQREFIKQTVKQTLKVSNITKIDDIMKIAQEEVETNIDWNVARDYIAAAVNFNTDNLKSEQLPGSTGYLNDVSFFFADENRTKQVVQSIFLTVNDHSDESNSTNETETNEVDETNSISSNTTNQTKAEKQATMNEAKNAIKSNSKVKVEIINGTGTSSKLDTVKEQLQNMGYKISNTSTSNIVDNTSVICRNADYIENAKSLQALLGPGSVVSGKENASIDITIILGKDY